LFHTVKVQMYVVHYDINCHEKFSLNLMFYCFFLKSFWLLSPPLLTKLSHALLGVKGTANVLKRLPCTIHGGSKKVSCCTAIDISKARQ